MKKHVYRASSFLLVISLCVSLLVLPTPASAAFVYNPSSTDGNAFMTWLRGGIADFIGVSPDSISFDKLVLPTTGQVTRTQMQTMRDNYNNWLTRVLSNPLLGLVAATKDTLLQQHQAVIAPDPMNGIMRLKDSTSGKWIYDSQGRYPYYFAMGDTPTDGPGTAPAEVPDFSATGTNKWVHYAEFPPKGKILSVVEKSALDETLIGLKDRGFNAYLWTAGNHYVIARTVGMRTEFWCDKSGNPFVASATPAAADNEYNYIIDNSDNSTNTTVDNKVIDTSNNTMTIINENGDKVTYNIDSLYWDASTHSYTANTYNVVNNTYNYYTWNITYNITNTYINYIGSNAAYQQEEYKYYYELPDGRSSEDLTAEEVGAMSFQFADVTNYARSATDTSLRALYHFDGKLYLYHRPL